MKSVLVLVLVAVVALAVVDAAGTTKKPCKVCDTNDYKPVCANSEPTASKAKPVTFGSQCVLEKAQCETGKTYPKIRDGECDKGAPVRLQ